MRIVREPPTTWQPSTTEVAGRCAGVAAEDRRCRPTRWSCCAWCWVAVSSAALALPATPATGEVDHLATAAMEHHLERRLRAAGAYS